MNRLVRFFPTAILLAAGVAQGQSTQSGMSMPMKPAAPAAASAAANDALVDGEVRRVDLEKGMVVLRHGDIPNLAMPPMTMGFDVSDKKMLTGFKVGDKVRFRAEMVQGRATVTQLERAK